MTTLMMNQRMMTTNLHQEIVEMKPDKALK
jgi:hypothetical protein